MKLLQYMLKILFLELFIILFVAVSVLYRYGL
nr:MAG TPA: hypothetical protein [Caudoviricetes sp.]